MHAHQLTVILQGPVSHPEANWVAAANSIKQVLPYAKLIAVQWENDYELVNADTQLLLKDPGSNTSPDGYVSNLWRQVYAMQSALRIAESTYVMKMRPDFIVDEFSDFFDTKTLAKRIRTLNVYTFDPRVRERLFWVSDMIQLGTREEMTKYWNISKELAQGQLTSKPRPYFMYELGASDMVKSSEQILTEAYIESCGKSIFRDLHGRTVASRTNFRTAIFAMTEVFDIVDWRESGLLLPNRFQLTNKSLWLNSTSSLQCYPLARIAHFTNKERLVNVVSGFLRFISPGLWRRIRKKYLVSKGAINS